MRRRALGALVGMLLASCAGTSSASGADTARAETTTEAETAPVPEPTTDSAPTRETAATVEPETTTATEIAVEPTREPTSPDTAVLDGWDELEPRIHAVYLATLRVRARPDGRNELCATASDRLAGAGPLPSREVCTAIEHILGATAPWPELATTGTGVVVTIRERGREMLLAAVRDEACGGDCRASYREALWGQVRCGDLARFWSSIPRADLACARDEECALLTSMCFETAVRDQRSSPYRDVLAAHGVCGHPAAGACAPSRARAVCRAGACTTTM